MYSLQLYVIKFSLTCDRLVVFSGYSGTLQNFKSLKIFLLLALLQIQIKFMHKLYIKNIVWIPLMARCTRYNIRSLATGLWLSLDTLVSSTCTNQTDRHDITEILLKLVLHNHNPNPIKNISVKFFHKDFNNISYIDYSTHYWYNNVKLTCLKMSLRGYYRSTYLFVCLQIVELLVYLLQTPFRGTPDQQ